MGSKRTSVQRAFFSFKLLIFRRRHPKNDRLWRSGNAWRSVGAAPSNNPLQNHESCWRFLEGGRALGGVCILQPRRLGQVHPEPIPISLVAAGHLSRGMAELLLDMALVDLGRGRQPGAQRMPGEEGPALGLG